MISCGSVLATSYAQRHLLPSGLLGKGLAALPTFGSRYTPSPLPAGYEQFFFDGELMSIAAIAWVFKQPLKPSWLKFLLLALADNANDEGHCYPSGKYLCIKTSLDRKTVISGLDQLEAKGYLIDTGQRKGVTKQVKVYQIRVPEEGLLNSTVNGTLAVERVPSVPGKSPVYPPKESRPRDTEPSRTIIEPLREDLPTRLKAMIASFEKIGAKAKAAKYRAELEALESIHDPS